MFNLSSSFPIAFGLRAEITVPTTIKYMDEFEVRIIIYPESQTSFDIVQILPNGWQVTNWTSDHNAFFETRDIGYVGKNVSAFRWNFENATGDTTIIYKAKAATMGINQITTIWISPEGFGSKDNTISVIGKFLFENTPVTKGALLLLLMATAIVIAGIAYREYSKMKKKKSKKRKR